MATSRPVSMIISSALSDETSTNGSKGFVQKKDSLSIRSSNQPKLPVNNLAIAHSSSSSIDSTGAKHAILNDKTSSLPPMNLTATVSSTTTDSEFESEQDERSTDDNHSSEVTNSSMKNQQQQQVSRRDSGRQKGDTNSSEQQIPRRVKHFQKLFKSEIADDNMPELIDSYVCAYQGDILLQGKMYITNRYLCFHSRIISYVTKHVYGWEQIENVTKERVAFIFPTAIGIQLKSSGKKIIYASFLQRDQAYDKILSICSQFNNETNSMQDDDDDDDDDDDNDDENHLTQSGTLKAINSHHACNGKMKKSKHNNHYETPDESEHDNVLQMCLRPDKMNNVNNNNNKRRPQSISSKSSDDKQQQQQQTRKLFNSDKKKTIGKPANIDQTLSRDFNETISSNNETIRTSRRSQIPSKQTESIPNVDSVVYRVSSHTTSRTRRNPSRDRTASPTNRTQSNLPQSNSSSNLMTTTDLSVINPHKNDFLRKYFRIIILSFISIIKLIMEYFLLLYNQFKTYPIKTSFILFIFVTILIVHSFYLIKLAYRIENRLQALHHVWPSMKTSLPAVKEL